MAAPRLPYPTDWIEHKAEGSPPPETLIVVLGVTEDEEPSVTVDLGYWSEKLSTFLEMSGLAIEERSKVTHYHIVHLPNKEPLLL